MNRKSFLKRLGIGIAALKIAPEILTATEEPNLTAEDIQKAADLIEDYKKTRRNPLTAQQFADLLEPGLSKIWYNHMKAAPPALPNLFKV